MLTTMHNIIDLTCLKRPKTSQTSIRMRESGLLDHLVAVYGHFEEVEEATFAHTNGRLIRFWAFETSQVNNIMHGS